MPKMTLLQLCPFAPALEADLAADFDVCRFFEIDDEAAWLVSHGSDVRAIATGGHIGAPATLVDALPNLGIIAINGVGFDKVDLGVARARGIRVTTTPNTLTDDVADLGVGLVIGLLRGIPASDQHVRLGRWEQSERPLGRTVSGKTFGIVGLGQIGTALAKRLSAFGSVLYTDLVEKPVPYEFVPELRTLAERVDVLVVASAASAATRHLINATILEALGSSGFLVNVARGSLVDQTALIDALEEGRVAGAALDVFADEPRVSEALRKSDKVVLTPHIASATAETRQRMAAIVLENLRAFASGKEPPAALVLG